MSPADRDVDLASLARPAAPAARARRRRLVSIGVPIAILLGFAAVLVSSLTDSLGGALAVEVVRPAPAQRGAARSVGAGQVVVQAAGWVEPDPFPIAVSALTAGVVSAVLVQESDAVRAGDPVARLVDEDARLAVRAAEAQSAAAAADVAAADAELAAARESFDAALAVRERAASARADLDGKRAEARHREQAAVLGGARLSAAESEVVVQRHLVEAGAAGPRAVELAEAALAAVSAELEILSADAELARAQTGVGEAVLARAERELELRTEEKLRVAAAEAKAALARAALAQVHVASDQAALWLARTTVRASVDGVVLQRLVAPGAELGPERSSVVTLYDPRSLRVRVDVPQADVAKLAVGQRVRVEADARAGEPYAGEVIRLVRQADINKVTVQAHVRLADGDELLRPEMLVQARFLSGDAPASAEGPTDGALTIPSDVVVEGSRVWVLDALGREARLRDVRLGAAEHGSVIVLEGLNLSDKVIATRLGELEPGRRVKVAEGAR